MKLLNNIKVWSCTFLVATSCLVSSCNFLDVVPVEQASLPDATKDAESTLGFLYSCYAGIRNPMSYTDVEASADEYAMPELWGHAAHKVAFNLSTPQSLTDHRWGSFYRFIGQTHLFLQELENAQGITEQQRIEWTAEAKFMLAYYHFEVLRFYGPCPITDSYVPQDTLNAEYHGRSHYDYVTEWIVNMLQDAINNGLPERRTDVTEWGRATIVIAKALKAKVLLYAASPLWNGSFPFPEWQNKNFETPGYGKELVSKTYSREKWVRAEVACEEALQSAIDNGFALFTNEEKYVEHKLPLPYIPNVNTTTEEGIAFAKKVLLMRYVIQMRASEGNQETIWGLNSDDSNYMASLPTRVLKLNSGNWYSGYSGISPYLYTIEHFYTKRGKIPEKDANFYNKEDWMKSAGIVGREDITNINMDREPRYYAWMAFNGGDFTSTLCAGEPLKLEMRDGEKQGYNPSLFNRDHCVTGFFTQKFFQPNINLSVNNAWNREAKPKPLIRMAELYLNLAECQAELGNQDALKNLNVVRERAGVPALTTSDVTGDMTLMDWVRNERFIELWGEGHRYFDIRRWAEGPKYLASGRREGLNAESKVNPTFEEYNQRVKVPQPYMWENRMYIAPIFYNEVYKNPQMVQAPNY